MQNFVYLPVATLSTQGNKKVLKQWKWRLKCIISWNEYQSKILVPQNQYLDCLVDLNFQGINRCFVLSYENDAHQTSHERYFLL